MWRRFIHDKAILSIFCDELDYQINLYDRDELESAGELEDALTRLESILDEYADEGEDPVDVFESISAECANGLESFLYDYIVDQIESDNGTYAADLVDSFYDFVKDVSWFDFLKARAVAPNDPVEANDIIKQLIFDSVEEPDLELNLEILAFLVQGGDRNLFLRLVQGTLPLLSAESELQELLQICADYCRCLDQEGKEQQLLEVIEQRADKEPTAAVDLKDPGLLLLAKAIGQASHPSSNFSERL